MTPTVVYTDGACSGNPGPGGWAWVVPDGEAASGFEPHTTNQRMELTAVLEAVTALPGPLEIHSDSTYVVNCFRDRWWEGWIARGWVNSQKKPVANRDLWEPLVDAYRARSLTFRWVKGHAGDHWNERADQLAVEALEAGRGADRRSPTAPGTGSDPTPPKNRSPGPRLDGHVLVVTGHRPPELGGYDADDAHAAIRGHLTRIIEAKASMHTDLVVVSALGLGAETLGAEAALEASVPLHVVLAHPGIERRWPAETRRRFVSIRDGASQVTILDRREPASRQAASASYARRDAWLRRVANEAIVVWDAVDPLVGRTTRSLQDELSEENVWILDPGEVAR